MEEKIVAQSPKAKVKEPVKEFNTFGFCDAISFIAEGKKVTKLEWILPEYFLELKDGRLKIHKPDGKYYDLVISDGDIFGTDWILVQ